MQLNAQDFIVAPEDWIAEARVRKPLELGCLGSNPRVPSY